MKQINNPITMVEYLLLFRLKFKIRAVSLKNCAAFSTVHLLEILIRINDIKTWILELDNESSSEIDDAKRDASATGVKFRDAIDFK